MELDRAENSEYLAFVKDVSHIITCLCKLFIAIRNPVPRDRLHKLASIDVSRFEYWDRQHISNKFPAAPKYLVERLGKANTKRRQMLKYYMQHHGKITRYIDLVGFDDFGPSMQRDDVASTSQPSKGDTKAPSTVSTTLNSQTTVSTIKPQLKSQQFVINEAGSDTGHSQTSYATSTNTSSTQQGRIDIPPPPNFNAAYDGQPFECPYCYTFVILDNLRSWK